MDEHEQANQNGGSLSLSRPVPLHLRLFKCLDRAALTENEQGDDDDDDDNDNGDRDECQMPLPDLRLLLLLLTIIIIISSLSLFRFFFLAPILHGNMKESSLSSGIAYTVVGICCLRHHQQSMRRVSDTSKTRHDTIQTKQNTKID